MGQVLIRAAGQRAGAPIPFVRSNAFEPFVSFLNTIGAPAERFLRQARISELLLTDAEALVPVFSAYRFVELAARQEHLEDLGVIVGQRACAFELGAYGALLQGTSTVQEYLQIGVRLIGAHSGGTRLWLTTEGEVLRVNQYLAGPPGLGRCTADLYTLVLTISTLRRIVGPGWSPGEVRLLTGDEALLRDREVFGDAPLITGQGHSSFTMSRSLGQLPVPGRRAAAAPGKDARLAASQSMPADFRTSAEHLVLSLLADGYSSIESTAEAAGLSSRTLQRRLAAAGVRYKDLVAAGRVRLAKDWLTASDLPIAELATRLGYTDASNFARAFRRQTGLSPGGYRRSRARDS